MQRTLLGLGRLSLFILASQCATTEEASENDLAQEENFNQNQEFANNDQGFEGEDQNFSEDLGDENIDPTQEEFTDLPDQGNEGVEDVDPTQNNVEDTALDSPELFENTSEVVENPEMTNPPAGGAMVQFVRQTTQIFEDSSGQQPVGTLEVGESVLVTLEGDWARTSDGKYISLADLSETMVARSFESPIWQGP